MVHTGVNGLTVNLLLIILANIFDGTAVQQKGGRGEEGHKKKEALRLCVHALVPHKHFTLPAGRNRRPVLRACESPSW